MKEKTPVTIGILSDTHLSRLTGQFRALAAVCFADASIILHAGDLADCSVLDVFRGKKVFAVRGNMCRPTCASTLPRSQIVEVGQFRIGLIHCTGYTYDFEGMLLNEFDGEVDCIVYGHTHKPVCHSVGGVLYINPGSFLPPGRPASEGTYALLNTGEELYGRLHHVPRLKDWHR
jgi:putative phosphoesterase